MHVTIQLAGIFQINRFKEAVHEYPHATCVHQVVDELKIPTPLLGTVLINGVHADIEQNLNDGDSVCFLPFLDGG
jgi:hypothetical protein